ncbi:MAG: restriction endonuclease subunit S [Candidatus Cloacimonadaceae bacterium]|jgi:type I restriction enzyme S subunit|nr:restriction endonuclease subunit S [Candidatus Cloacimonadaceae bacterium]
MSEWIRIEELSSIFSVVNDKRKQLKTSCYYASGKYPIIDQSSDFICGYSDREDVLFSSPLPIIVFGDHTRWVKYVDFPFIAGADGTQILKASDWIDSKFLFYVVQKASQDIGNFGYDRHLKHLKRYPTSVPAKLSEQRKIADILSTVDDVIEMTEAAIEKYKAMKDGMMQDLFTRGIDTKTGKLRPTIEEAPELYKESEFGWIPKGWDATEFKDACLEYINGGTPSTKNASNWVGNIPWITGADFLESFEVGFIRRHINEDALRYSSSHLIREGNILLVTRTGVGKLAIAPFDVAISQDITGIILDPSQYCVEFFYYYLQILVEDFKKMNQGTSINGIIRSDLEATLILKPSLDEQKQIAAVLNAFDENLKNEQSNLNKYRDLKRGLMADLLTGKVRIK